VTRTIEGVRIFRGPEGEPDGLLRRFLGDTGSESDFALQRCKDLLIAVTHWIPAPGERQPTLDDWRARLPDWFVAACAPELTEAEAAEEMKAWRALDTEGKALYEAEHPWTLANWLAWFAWDSDVQRSWRWWDGGVIDDARFWIDVEVLNDPGAVGSLLWMMRAAGARPVVEVDHPAG